MGFRVVHREAQVFLEARCLLIRQLQLKAGTL